MTIAGKNEIDIDATPIAYLPIGNLYRAFSQLPRGTGFDLTVAAVRFVAYRLQLQAELHAVGASVLHPIMNLAHAGERSRELVALLDQLEGRTDKGS